MSDPSEKPAVELVRSSYQPSKAELEEENEFPEGIVSRRVALERNKQGWSES